ncbi:MAG TPA: HAMP domain-containing sensor histidine kinase [Thermoanaerobaculia bacterium]|nr:HAMP domain-containing sensor histidine kinase [Thermoanaerobaculia bacterium]
MGRPEWERLLLPLTVVFLTALLVVLAVLQYRWIGEIGKAERDRLRAGLQAAADRAGDEVDQEITRIWLAFQPGSADVAANRRESLVRQLAAWRRTTQTPGLVAAVFVAGRGAAPALERLDEASGRFIPVSWPDDLNELRAWLQRTPADLHRPLAPPPGPGIAGAPVVIVPFARLEPGVIGFDHRQVTILRLDRRRLVQELIAGIVERQLGLSGPSVLRVAVLAPGDRPVWRSDPRLPVRAYLPAEVERPLVGQRGTARMGTRGTRSDPPAPPPGRPPGDLRRGPPLLLTDGPWRLVIRPAAGSLDAVVARARERNLAVSAGVLALLAASFAVLVVAAQRARRLARQRMELVAGVTHELNTPLAAIRSAGQNLADGVVADAEQVRRYGALIEREGQRLSALVGQALKLAGIESGARVWRPEPAPVAEAVEESLADCRWLLAENGTQVETELPADLPEVLIDRGALGLIVRNLVDNAARHGRAGKWVGVSARLEPDGSHVLLTVEDRGPGIAPEDRPHLFEPFYRGRKVVGSAIPGSGLGLDLVRRAAAAHGGTVSVGPGPGGRGARFAVRLPAAIGSLAGSGGA